MDKLKMQSENLIDRNVGKIAEMFPNCITEVIKGYSLDGKVYDTPILGGEPITQRVVDFDLLRQELSSVLVEGKDERYRLDWSGKRQAVLTANSPIAKTLRPVREDETTPTGQDSKGNAYKSTGSVGKDGTKGGFDSENLYIEGDNLDVLKLLHETYLAKIKMIYIDPPYNTGNDFVYNDNFSQDAEEYLASSNQVDEDKNKLTTNKDTSGRYHSDWLSMMYMRLKLSRDLLTDDGVIFISIDDNEQANLKKICDEIFGADNFVNQFAWISNLTGRQIAGFGAAKTYETILVYAKNTNNLSIFSVDIDFAKSKMSDVYKGFVKDIRKDSYGEFAVGDTLYNHNRIFNEETRRNLVFSIFYNPTTEEMCSGDIGERKENFIEILPHKNNDGVHKYHAWRWSRQKVDSETYNLIVLPTKIGYEIYTKIRDFTKTTIKDIISNISNGELEVREVFDGRKYFDYPKSIDLLKLLTNSLDLRNEIILDFFSGSATTAHAVMQLNAEDGGNRKFIMVQLPEKTDEKSEAYKAGYSNICEIGKERIRRAGAKIAAANQMTAPNLDIGFRVLKLDSSNMKDVYYNPSEYLDKGQSFLFELDQSIKADRTAEDILLQVMLDKGVLLSSKIEKRTAAASNQTYYVVGNTDFDIIDLICCFDTKINTDAVKEIAKLKPECCVFLDSGIASDSTRTNIEQIFDTYSPTTKVEVI